MDQNDVGFQRVVVAFSEFDLPCSEAFGVVEDVFESVEIDEGAFELVDMEVFEIGDAGDFS